MLPRAACADRELSTIPRSTVPACPVGGRILKSATARDKEVGSSGLSGLPSVRLVVRSVTDPSADIAGILFHNTAAVLAEMRGFGVSLATRLSVLLLRVRTSEEGGLTGRTGRSALLSVDMQPSLMTTAS